MLFQDIHNSDFDKWKQFRQAVQSDDMTTALELIELYKKTAKILNSGVLNELFSVIGAMQELSDDNFKADKIQTAISAPSTLVIGDVYFKEYE